MFTLQCVDFLKFSGKLNMRKLRLQHKQTNSTCLHYSAWTYEVASLSLAVEEGTSPRFEKFLPPLPEID